MWDGLEVHSDLLLAGTAAASVFAAFLVVLWPYIAPDTLDVRLQKIANERAAIRTRERRKLNGPKAMSLRAEPKKLFKNVFDCLNLAKHAEEGETVRKLRMAGYRGEAPVVTFVAMRLLAPAATFAFALFYVFVVLRVNAPPMFKLSGAMAAATLAYYLPALYVKNRIGKRQKAIRRSWPDALDLLLICVESGMGIESAFRKVADEIRTQSAELADELSVTTAELSYLPDRRKAYENLGARTSLDAVKSVVTSLIQAERYGTPVGQALRVLAQESREMRMSEAEKKAAALPPKLTVPMILFFLPVLFAVIITPAIIQITNLR
jgi:tight adherence protein C